MLRHARPFLELVLLAVCTVLMFTAWAVYQGLDRVLPARQRPKRRIAQRRSATTTPQRHAVGRMA